MRRRRTNGRALESKQVSVFSLCFCVIPSVIFIQMSSLVLSAQGNHYHAHGTKFEDSRQHLDDLGSRLGGEEQKNPTTRLRNDTSLFVATLNGTFNFADGAYLSEECAVGPDTQVDDLDDSNCKIIRSFNQTALDQMAADDMIDMVSFCACQLANMYHLWQESFDDTWSTRRVATMVDRLLSRDEDDDDTMTQQQRQQKKSKYHKKSIRMAASSTSNNNSSPNYLWNDIDVTIYEISIYTATQDYFHQQIHNKSMAMSTELRHELEHNQTWRLIWEVCRKISRDPHHLYRYMENIIRASPPIFFNILQISDDMATVYDASKACKLPLMMHFQRYKLKAKQSNDGILNPLASNQISFSPANLTVNNGSADNSPPADPTASLNPDETNTINTNANDIDLMLINRDVSTLLLRCDKWRDPSGSRNHSLSAAARGVNVAPAPVAGSVNLTLELARDCPMMVGDSGPTEWTKEHPSPADRSMASIRCGCQLIKHNATWHRMMQDHHVQVMAKALTNYMNRNQVPDFVNTPIWSLFGWFESIMSKFTRNRKPTIKEVVKTLSGDQDPLEMKSKLDSNVALELCRRACNFIMFNYNKGADLREQQIELKSIKYLDNLQLISQDPMFVFHLTLQDPNLFKIYALSRMCLPFVS